MTHLSKRILYGIPNPFAAPLDQHGRPCGAAMRDPEMTLGSPRYVGATLARKVVSTPSSGLDDRHIAVRARAFDKGTLDAFGGQARYDTTWTFDLAPQPLEDTRYHRDALARGELLVADQATANFLKLPFVDPMKRLALARDARIAEWTAQTEEEPDFALWQPELRPPSAAPPAPSTTTPKNPQAAPGADDGRTTR